MSATLQPSRIRHQRFGAAFPRRDRSTKSAASSASLRSVLRGVPNCARMVRPRAKSVTWLARAATGKSGGMSPTRIPSGNGAPPAAAPPRDRALQEPPNLSVVHKRRDAHQKAPPGGPFLGRTFDGVPQKAAIESRRLCGERSAFAADAPFRSAYALRTRKNIARLPPKTAYRLGRPTPIPATRSSIVTSVVAVRPEHLSRLFQRPRLVEAARASTWPSVIVNHLVQNSLTMYTISS